MKWKWLAIAMSAAVPTVAIAQQDAKDNTNQDASAEVRAVQQRAGAQRQRAEAEMQRAAQSVKTQANDRIILQLRDQKQIKAAWLGLSASQAPAALRRQLKLPDGTGLVIDFTQPDSPAAKAGLKQYDLLTRLNDQILVNSEQLSVLVRTFKPGNKVHLQFLREGERQSVDAELVEHEVPPLGEETGPGANISQFQFQPRGMDAFRPGDQANANAGAGGGADFKGMPGEYTAKRRDEEHQTLTLVDGKHQLSVEVTDGRRILSVLDNRNGRLISKYPIDTDEQIHGLPDDIRKPLDRLLPLLNSEKFKGIAGKPESPNGPKDPPNAPPRPDGKPGPDGPRVSG